MKILMVTHRLPFAPNRGDRMRAYHELRHLASFAEVHVASLAQDRDDEDGVAALDGVAASVFVGPVPRYANHAQAAISLFSSTPLTHVLLRSPALDSAVDELATRIKPDLVFSYCTGVAPVCLRPSLRRIPCVLDMVDVDSGKWAALAETVGLPMSWVYRREAGLLADFERSFCAHAKATLLVNERERQALIGRVAPGRVHVLEVGIDLERLAPPNDNVRSRRAVFTGVMNYAPNEAGAEWIAKQVWPVVRREHPDAELHIVGASPSRRVRALADQPAGVVVTGTVPDTRPHLWAAKVAVAPLQVARGVQTKVLEALGAGLPCVVTPEVAGGLPTPALAACDVERGAEAFASRMGSWLNASDEARAKRLNRVDMSSLSWASALAPLRALMERAAQPV